MYGAFSFSSGGFNGMYGLGAGAEIFLETRLDRSRKVFCGVSAGAAVAACLCCDVDPSVLAERMLATFSRHVSHKEIARRSLAHLRELLPTDAHERCTNRLFVHVTFVPGGGETVSRFESREDLLSAIHASSFVPILLGTSLACRFRNRWCVDGGFSDNLIDAPSSSSVARTLKISSTGDPRADVRHKEYRQIESYFNTGERHLREIYARGRRDARAFLNATTPNATTPAAATESSRLKNRE